MKLQWKSVSPEQERRNSLLHGYRSLIGEIPVWFGGLHLLLGCPERLLTLTGLCLCPQRGT